MNFFSSISESIATVVKDTAVTLYSEGSSFLDEGSSEEAGVDKSTDEGYARLPKTLPWKEVHPSVEQEVKERIFALSKKKDPFISSPPLDAHFSFALEDYLPLAALLIEADPELNKTRFWLVPKYVRETPFWRNYFYHVQLIKDSYPSMTIEEEVASAVGQQDRPLELAGAPSLEQVPILRPSSPAEHLVVDVPPELLVETQTPPAIMDDDSGSAGIVEVDTEQEDWEKELEAELAAELADVNIGE